MNDSPDVVPTPASEAPTAPDAPIPGTALDAERTLPEQPAAQMTAEDLFAALKQRPHPFAD